MENIKRYSIIGSFPYHLECIGCLQHIIGNIDVYVNEDKFKDIEYFNDLYKFNSYHISQFNSSNYDCIIKLSSDDRCFDIVKEEDKHKLISLLHLTGFEFGLTKFIKFSEHVTTNEYCKYIFPYYKTNITGGVFEKRTIVYIGYFDTYQLNDDFLSFINNSGYKFYFCCRIETAATKILKSMKNVVVFYGLTTPEINRVLKNTTFLLGRIPENRVYDRFTGALTLSITNKIPIICPKKLAGSTPAILFEDDYCEVLDYVKNISKQQYEDMICNINDYIDVIEKDNVEQLNIFFNHITST